MSTPQKRGFLKRVANRISQSSALGSTSPGPPSTTSSASFSAPTLNAIGVHLESRSRAVLDAALKELDEEDQGTISRNSPNASTDIDGVIRQAYEAAVQKQELCDKKRWEWTLLGRTVVLRDEAGKVVRWLDKFKAVGDVVANVDPLHVGLPWAGIRMLLVMTVAGHQQVAALVTGMSLVLAMVNRLQVYWAFMDHLPPSTATSNLEKALVSMYVHILRFICRAIRMYERNSVRRLTEALWAHADLEDFEMECDIIAQRAEVEASNCDREINYRNWRDLQAALKHIDDEQGKLGEIRDSVTQSSIKANLRSLATVEHAVYNSHADEDLSRCLDGTRTDILDHIYDWASSPDSKSIFWLRGMAGTGKSTILRTAAHHLDSTHQRLGASFFFKRGEGDRGNAKRFFPTIAVQLAARISGMDQAISNALDREPFAADLSLRVQFDKLILSPLLDLSSRGRLDSAALTIVIDALDECDRITDIQNMIQMIGEVGSRSSLRLRVLVSSRPEIPIVTSLERLDSSLHEDIVLEDMQTTTIEHDIGLFLRDGFAEIRRRDADINPDDPIPDAWPAVDDLQALVSLANPLFIFAATVCRFISSARDPQRRLTAFLQQQQSYALSGLDAVYLPILMQSIEGCSTTEQDSVIASFRLVVGSIVTLNEALPAKSLAHLLDLRPRDVRDALRDLHSIIKVPKDSTETIHLFHLSFQDFLLEKTVHADHPFRINPDDAHLTLWRHCIRILQQSLKRDICDVADPGRKRGTTSDIGDHIPADVAYACRNWVQHLENSRTYQQQYECVNQFLHEHLLHWIEVMSWLGRIYECFAQLRLLSSMYRSDGDHTILPFLSDAERFVQRNLSILDEAPLQLYSSALLFAPTRSVVKGLFKQRLMVPLNFLPDVEDNWGPEIQTFEGYRPATDFSSDGRYFAYTDRHTLKIWDQYQSDFFREIQFEASVESLGFLPCADPRILIATDRKTYLRDLNSNTEMMQYSKLNQDSPTRQLKISPNGRFFTTLDQDGMLEVWNLCIEQRLWSRQIKTSPLGIAVAIGDEAVAVLSEDTNSYQLFRNETGELAHASNLLSKFLGASDCKLEFKNVSFSPDHKSIAISSNDKSGTIVILALPGIDERKRIWFGPMLQSFSYSPDGQYIVAHGLQNVCIFSIATGLAVAQFRVRRVTGFVSEVRIATAPSMIWTAITCTDRTISLRRADIGIALFEKDKQEEMAVENRLRVKYLAFDSTGDRLLSVYTDSSAKLWNARSGKLVRTLWSAQNRSIEWASFLPDDFIVITVSPNANEFCLRNIASGEVVKKRVTSYTPDVGLTSRVSLTAGGRLIMVYDLYDAVAFFLDVTTLTKVEVLHCYCNKDEQVRVSWNTQWFPAGIPYIGERRLSTSEEDPSAAADEQGTNRTMTLNLEGAWRGVKSYLMSSNGELIAIQTSKGKVHIVSTKSEKIVATLTPLSDVNYMAFSPKSSCLAMVGSSSQHNAELCFWRGSTMIQTKRFPVATAKVAAMVVVDGDMSILCSTAYGDVYCYNLSTGELVWAARGPLQRETIVSFSQDGACLITRKGSITLDHDERKGCMKVLHFDMDRTERWIRREGRNVIWLPPELRDRCISDRRYSAESPHHIWRNNLVIDQSSGRNQITMLQFKDNSD